MLLFFILLFTWIILIIYVILILFFANQYRKLAFFTLENTSTTTTFSIIIPARNEADNIAICLRSILNNQYAKNAFEIIVIDDHSQDDTAAIVENFTQEFSNVRLFRMQELLPDAALLNSYKKKAITLAIAQAHFEYIICTDADCMVDRNWLHNFDSYIQQHRSVFIAGPVQFVHTGSLLSAFQCLDFTSLQSITAASVATNTLSMCNGANLCYSKKAFEHVDGFTGVDNLASGDDMFLMYKMQQQFPEQIGYIFHPTSTVKTLPMPDLSSFLNQRIRWASKADKYKDKRVIATLVLIYLLNVFLFILMFGAFFSHYIAIVWLLMIGIKIVVELSIMLPAMRFFNQIKLFPYFILIQPLHITYTVIAGFLGKFGKYQWKGRTVK